MCYRLAGLLDLFCGASDYPNWHPLAKAVPECQVASSPGLILGLQGRNDKLLYSHAQDTRTNALCPRVMCSGTS